MRKRPLPLVALVCLTAMSCGRSRTLAVEDLLVEARQPIERLSRPRLFSCGEEEHLAVSMGGQGRAEWESQIDGDTSLEVTLCGTGGRLRVDALLPDGRREGWDLEIGPSWTSSTLPLSGEGRVRLSLAVHAQRGQPVFLRDLALRSERPAAAPRPAQRAILISLDTVRDDAVGAVGAQSGTAARETPHLDRLAAEAERFFPHWSAEISTLPSHASMLSGLPARVHGADRIGAPLSPGVTTLAQRLRDRGVATAGLASGAPFFHSRYGLDRGFDFYRIIAWSPSQELRSAVAWVAAHRDQSFFLFVHLYAAHSDNVRLPYEAPGSTVADVETRFGLADYGCRRLPSPAPAAPAAPAATAADVEVCASRLLKAMNLDRELRPRPREAEALRYLYDRGVTALDRNLAHFFDELRAMGLWDETLVIVTADHGEQFGEHGLFIHATAHEETLRVPLLVKWPHGRRAGAITERPSTSLDLVPTLLAHFGAPAEGLVGHDLAQPLEAGSGSQVMVSFDAIRVGNLKLVLESPQYPESLYDLALDPEEQHNLLPEQAAEAERLRTAWVQYVERARTLAGRPAAAQPLPFDAEEIERLKSLGYLN